MDILVSHLSAVRRASHRGAYTSEFIKYRFSESRRRAATKMEQSRRQIRKTLVSVGPERDLSRETKTTGNAARLRRGTLSREAEVRELTRKRRPGSPRDKGTYGVRPGSFSQGLSSTCRHFRVHRVSLTSLKRPVVTRKLRSDFIRGRRLFPFFFSPTK